MLAIVSWIWSVGQSISDFSSTANKPILYLPIKRAWYIPSNIFLGLSNIIVRMLFYDNPCNIKILIYESSCISRDIMNLYNASIKVQVRLQILNLISSLISSRIWICLLQKSLYVSWHVINSQSMNTCIDCKDLVRIPQGWYQFWIIPLRSQVITAKNYYWREPIHRSYTPPPFPITKAPRFLTRFRRYIDTKSP